MLLRAKCVAKHPFGILHLTVHCVLIGYKISDFYVGIA